MVAIDFWSPGSLVAAVALILLSIVYYYLKNRNLLPGPKGLPFFGIYPFLNHETCHLQLEEYGKKYGDLYSFTCFGYNIINLGSAKAIREVHINKSDCFAGRFEDFNMLTYLMPDGVAFVNGESWKVQRKFFIQSFKEYGLTAMRDNTAGPIQESINLTLKDLHSRKGSAFNVMDLLNVRCTGTLRKVLFGEDGVSDNDMYEMISAYAVTLDSMTGAKLLVLGPVGKLIFKTLPEYRGAIKNHRIMNKILLDTVKTIESNMDENHITCVVEEYYKEQRQRRRKNDPTWKYFTDKALVQSLSQIVGDGIVSVAYFVAMFLYAVVQHPEEQKKIYDEIMEVIGPTRMPSPEDKPSLRYTNAFINEVMRTSNFFTLFPSMGCTKETTVRGYRIPKGSITMLNMWQAHHDPNSYKNPYKFDPSRFLQKEGRPKPESITQFGLGKRSCTGEQFAMLQAFMFLTSIIKTFKISEPNPKSKSETFLMTGFMELSFESRKEN